MILRRRTGDPQVSLSASPAQPPGPHASAIRATTASPSSGPAAASAAAGQFLACFSPSRAPALLAAANRSLHKECDPIEREAEVEDNARPPQTSAARAPSVRSRWRPREPRALCATRQARSAHWPIRSCELLSAPRCEVTVASSICLRRLSLSEEGAPAMCRQRVPLYEISLGLDAAGLGRVRQGAPYPRYAPDVLRSRSTRRHQLVRRARNKVRLIGRRWFDHILIRTCYTGGRYAAAKTRQRVHGLRAP